MTRINLIDPEELTDQHLFAEFREIKMVPKSLARSIAARGAFGVLKVIPPQFTLGKGHVSFFYDKGEYLKNRYELLKNELTKRGIKFNAESQLDPDKIYFQFPDLYNDWKPCGHDLKLIRARIEEKIAMKRTWYRYYGEPLLSQERLDIFKGTIFEGRCMTEKDVTAVHFTLMS